MTETSPKQNSLQAWVLAARPKTLTGAAVPVMMGLALSLPVFSVVPAVLCLLFAFVMQIDANLVNDYFDWRKGTDDEHRLGPRRACAEGWVTPSAMRRAIALTTLLACVTGLPLVLYGGVGMLWIGAACVLFCFLYTVLFSYIGLGDVLVLLFFGLVPVCATFFLQTHVVTIEVVVASLACGLVVDTLLVVNNYRDRDNDGRVGKRTLVVLVGGRAAEWLYLMLGIVAVGMGVVFALKGCWFTFLLPFAYLVLHARTYRKMKTIGRGKALNGILAKNARNMFLYGLLFCLGAIIDTL